jgi:hypothetical protein
MMPPTTPPMTPALLDPPLDGRALVEALGELDELREVSERKGSVLEVDKSLSLVVVGSCVSDVVVGLAFVVVGAGAAVVVGAAAVVVGLAAAAVVVGSAALVVSAALLDESLLDDVESAFVLASVLSLEEGPFAKRSGLESPSVAAKAETLSFDEDSEEEPRFSKSTMIYIMIIRKKVESKKMKGMRINNNKQIRKR